MLIKEEKFSRSLPVTFTPDQIRAFSDELATVTVDITELDETRKRVNADFASQLKTKCGRRDVLARHITNKNEYQMVECVAHMDTPEHGKKTIYRLDTAEVVGVEVMNMADRAFVQQGTLAFDESQQEGELPEDGQVIESQPEEEEKEEVAEEGYDLPI